MTPARIEAGPATISRDAPGLAGAGHRERGGGPGERLDRHQIAGLERGEAPAMLEHGRARRARRRCPRRWWRNRRDRPSRAGRRCCAAGPGRCPARGPRASAAASERRARCRSSRRARRPLATTPAVAMAAMPRASRVRGRTGSRPCGSSPVRAGISAKLAAVNSSAWAANSQKMPAPQARHRRTARRATARRRWRSPRRWCRARRRAADGGPGKEQRQSDVDQAADQPRRAALQAPGRRGKGRCRAPRR